MNQHAPGDVFPLVAPLAIPGIAAQLTVKVTNSETEAVYSNSAAGIAERESGVYSIEAFTTPPAEGYYRVEWYQGSVLVWYDEFQVTLLGTLGSSFPLVAVLGTTGIASQLTVAVINSSTDATYRAASNTGIAEREAGVYSIEAFTAPTTEGYYRVNWYQNGVLVWYDEFHVARTLPPATDLLKDLRIAVADAISLGIPDIQAVPLMISNPTPPHAYVYPGPATYDLAMGRGLDDLELRVRAYIGQTSDQAAQLRLDELIEPGGGRSMKAAIEADTTLGGLVGYGGCRVTSNSGYQEYQVQGHGPYLGCEWTLQIYASGG